MDFHLFLLASKKASIDTSNAGVEGVVAWIIHHINTLDGVMKLLLSAILVASALLRFFTGALKFYYTLKNKGSNGD